MIAEIPTIISAWEFLTEKVVYLHSEIGHTLHNCRLCQCLPPVLRPRYSSHNVNKTNTEQHMKNLMKLLLMLVLASSLTLQAQEKAKPVISILGDSYSTFEGYIPEGNESWYFTVPVKNRTDVVDVKQTWWWKLISEGGYILGKNDSYSGATICFTGYRGEDYSARSFITRLPRVGVADILLIFGATNDSWANSPIGEYSYDNVSREMLYAFRPAMGKLLREAQNRYPGTRIVFVINSELKPEITGSAIEICNHYGVEYIELHDIDKSHGHPSVKGMAQIKAQILDFLKK